MQHPIKKYLQSTVLRVSKDGCILQMAVANAGGTPPWLAAGTIRCLQTDISKLSVHPYPAAAEPVLSLPSTHDDFRLELLN